MPVLLVIDGMLGLMAYLATQSVTAGVAVWLVMFSLMCLELAIVAWATRLRQQQEARRQD